MAGELHAIAPPPNDGMTIENEPVTDADNAADATSIEMLPPSKLPPASQFRILSGWWRADQDFSHEWRAQAKMWYEFRAGDHWTAEDKALLDSRQRPHIVFNRVLKTPRSTKSCPQLPNGWPMSVTVRTKRAKRLTTHARAGWGSAKIVSVTRMILRDYT